jgi:hypothetical protein
MQPLFEVEGVPNKQRYEIPYASTGTASRGFEPPTMWQGFGCLHKLPSSIQVRTNPNFDTYEVRVINSLFAREWLLLDSIQEYILRTLWTWLHKFQPCTSTDRKEALVSVLQHKPSIYRYISRVTSHLVVVTEELT